MIELRESTKDEINHRAYALYLVRGCEQGRDVEDWFRAEKELTEEPAGGTATKSASQIGESRYPWPVGI